ncbi:hypothetical protein L21SP4_01515 [Kiritimatiella glycovorans]|uniref:Uncharacterized protein n=1 Tax=Kiritimatiella glycovorans TaxID=1307763 RepID=A0A0G3EIV0_9BACT|nr:hypothetical protein L21SP4_01515 [Kiritimatiella glycovorans]
MIRLRTRTHTRSVEDAILFPTQEIEHEYRFAEYEYDVTRADLPPLTIKIHE